MLGWYIGILGILMGTAGGVYFIMSLGKMSEELKSSISFLVIAAFIYVVFSSIMVILGLTKNSSFNNIEWQLVPVLFTVSTIFFALGSKRLIELMSGLDESNIEEATENNLKENGKKRK